MKEPQTAPVELDRTASAIPVGDIPVKEFRIKDLPLFMVISNMVYDVDLPCKEFMSTEEFEEYLDTYAGQNFDKPEQRNKFIKKHVNNALYIDDEIHGEYAWQVNREINIKNARICGFGILKTQSQMFLLFDSNLGRDIPSQLAAYQSLTYGRVDPGYLHHFANRESRSRLKETLGDKLYGNVIQALGIPGHGY